MGAVRNRRNLGSCAGTVGSFEWAEALLAATGRLTPEQVALVLEKNPATPLTRTLWHYLIRLKRRDRRPGVKPKNAAAWEFILFDAKALYETRLREYLDHEKSSGTGRDAMEDREAAASEHAYRAVLAELKANICDMDWVALRNLISLHILDAKLFLDFRVEGADGTDREAGSDDVTLPEFINDNRDCGIGLGRFAAEACPISVT
jgi:hypothetical protein